MLPTNQKTNIINTNQGLLYNSNDYIGINQHLYIISDDEIKEGDWVYENNLNTETNIYQVYKRNNKLGIFRFRNVFVELSKSNCKKIIATTDTSLIEESRLMRECYSLKIGQPSQQFIQKYIEEYNKGNVITDVLVEYENIYIDAFDTVIIQHEKDTDSYLKQCKFISSNLKINPKDNTITIKKVKDSYTREEVIELCKQAFIDGTYSGGFGPNEKTINNETEKWIEENL